MIPVTTTSARRTLVIAFSTAVAAAVAMACGPDEPELGAPIDGDTYVTVMGELADLDRFPPPGPGDAARADRADSARQAILERHGVTANELLEFAEAAGARPDLMVELSERIAALSDSLAQRRTGPGRAADSAAARDIGLEPEREYAAETVSDSAVETASDIASEAADSTPTTRVEPRSIRERARELRERSDTEREPSP